MDNARNMMLAVVLMAVVLIGWPLLTNRFFPTVNPPSTAVVKGGQVALPQPQAGPAAETPPARRDRAAVLADSPRLRIETPRLKGSIALRGARIDDLVLADYGQTIARGSPPIRLLSPAGAPDAYFASFGWTGANVALPDRNTAWTADAPVLTPARPVTLSWTNPQGLRFALRVAIDANYMFSVQQFVTNGSAGAVALRPYGLISRTGISKDIGTATNHVGPLGVFGGGVNYDVDYTNLQGQAPGIFKRVFGTSAHPGPNEYDARGGWLGFGDKYWLTALIPDQGTSVHSSFRGAPGDVFQADFTTQPVVIQPGRTAADGVRLFAGAKEVNVLDHYESSLGIAHFGKAIDWGWFEIIEKPIFMLLDWLFRNIGNFGVAIIVLTFIVRSLMFPVAQRQFRSMAGMRVVQPKMKALQERYKDDKETLQKEMLALYRQEKVNPLAGCLPIFFQIPIFYALYKVLTLSIEMRHQPFALWIRDLSAPDPLTPVNLFGFLPFDPPGILHLGVLAILLGVTMWLQMKLNPTPATDPAQQQVMMLMPWMMMLFFAPLAAGLQLYYVANNLLSLAQQQWLYRRHGVPAVAS